MKVFYRKATLAVKIAPKEKVYTSWIFVKMLLMKNKLNLLLTKIPIYRNQSFELVCRSIDYGFYVVERFGINELILGIMN